MFPVSSLQVLSVQQSSSNFIMYVVRLELSWQAKFANVRIPASSAVVGLVIVSFSWKLFAVQLKGCELFADPQFNIPTLRLLK